MKALSLIQWLVSWGHCRIFEIRLCRTLVDGPVAELDKNQGEFIKKGHNQQVLFFAITAW